MKRNIGLFLVLVSLIVVTYFVQEKPTDEKFLRMRSEGRLIVTDFRRLKWNDVNASNREGRWFHEGILLSHNQLKLLTEKLGQIKIIKDIPGKLEDFFKDGLHIEVNGEDLVIGQMSLDKSGFYVAKNGKIHLAVVDSGSNIVSEDVSPEEQKLSELKSLLSKDLKHLKETQLFRYYPARPTKGILVESDGGLPYELDFEKDQTLPPPISGIEAHSDLEKKFTSALSQVLVKEQIPYDEKLKQVKLSTLSFIGETGQKKLTWELWMRSKTKADPVLIDEEGKKAYLMLGGTLGLFFIQVQDYWDKKVIPSKMFKTFDRLPVIFTQGSREVKFSVLNREPLGFEGAKIKSGNAQDLFQLIFNLGPRDQAGRVSQLSKSEKQQLLSSNLLKIALLDQEILCVSRPHELILVNLTQGFKAHFLNPLQNLHCQLSDVIE